VAVFEIDFGLGFSPKIAGFRDFLDSAPPRFYLPRTEKRARNQRVMGLGAVRFSGVTFLF